MYRIRSGRGARREIWAGYKLYYHGEDGTKNGVGIVLREDMIDRLLAVERTCDRVMRKLEIEGHHQLLRATSGMHPRGKR